MAENRTTGLDLRVLEDRQVMLFFGDNPTIDKKTGAFVGGWDALGLEPEDSQHSHTREVSSNNTNLTGGQTATSYSAGAITASVDGIAGSPAMRYIENPGAVVQDGTTYGEHSSKVAKAFVAFVHKFTSGLVRIWVSREKAELVINERVTAKDPQARPVQITFKNGDDERYYEERFYMIGDDGSVVRVEEKIFKDVSDLQAQIEAGTAFHPKASSNGLTAMTVVEDEAAAGVTLHEFTDPATGETVNQNTASGAFNLEGATGGTYTVTVGSNTTSALSFDASASDLQSALRAAGESSATVTGDASTGFVISNVSAKPTVDGSSLEGGTFPTTVTVS